MNAFADLQFSPLIPLPWLLALALAAAMATAAGLWRRVAGTGWRLLAMALVLAALTDPRLVAEQRQPLADIVLVMVDDSPSQRLADRPAQTARALAHVQEKLAALPNLEVRIRHHDGDSKIFGAMQAALADLPRRRLSGIILISDGRVHDLPAAALGAPLHVLLTGSADERDRRAIITRTPAFALVGRNAQLGLRLDDPHGKGGAPVTISVDGSEFLSTTLPLNRDVTVDIPVRHAGQVIVEIATPVTDGDLMPANNRTATAIGAVRDRLKVLLISGEPHAGERVWRNLLKSDPAVDLVHFTILRPPEKDDRTPIRELALITFPVRELFEEKLKDFDLVVFDRYRHRGIMAAPYYQFLSQYVQGGGALLAAAGPEYTEADSTVSAALGDILPTSPEGGLIQSPFIPTLTEAGRRHPVTAGLPKPAEWGPWLRQIPVRQNRGTALLQGADGKPLLVLDQVGRGRVAQVLSDTIWLWARGYQGGGPHDELLRRLAHWLMREPELEAESLNAIIQGGQLHLTRRSLTAGGTAGGSEAEITAAGGGEAEITAPDGSVTAVTLKDRGDGAWIATVAAPQPGLWTARADSHVALAAQGSLTNPELAEITATAAILAPVVAANEGSIRHVQGDGLPELRQVGGAGALSGPHWLGLVRRGDYAVHGIRQNPLLPPALLLALAAAALLLGWKRESR
ncbi:MAG: hypothetical protein FD176_85 [Rhodospirillaceae bacterium]|nr:MAG: hypothetical protein FD176_85 [Rhodospirillaceae bacterium]TNC94869.1 MAG: hypothetical protein FD119_2918 [Stygiobacter sp.]